MRRGVVVRPAGALAATVLLAGALAGCAILSHPDAALPESLGGASAAPTSSAPTTALGSGIANPAGCSPETASFTFGRSAPTGYAVVASEAFLLKDGVVTESTGAEPAAAVVAGDATRDIGVGLILDGAGIGVDDDSLGAWSEAIRVAAVAQGIEDDGFADPEALRASNGLQIPQAIAGGISPWSTASGRFVEAAFAPTVSIDLVIECAHVRVTGTVTGATAATQHVQLDCAVPRSPGDSHVTDLAREDCASL